MQKKRNFVAQKSIGIKDMSQKEIHLKAVLFDMDGVLFNSMPYHAEAWHKVMQAHGLNLSREEAYLHEGRTGAGTINIVCQRQLGREATPDEIENIYHEQIPRTRTDAGSLGVIAKNKKSRISSYGSYRFWPAITTGPSRAQFPQHISPGIDGDSFRRKTR